MSVARAFSSTVIGVQAHIVEVEAHLQDGLPGFAIVGLPDASVNEARDRVRAAVANSKLRWPAKRITVGLSPAWLPKRGAGMDLAIALAVLAADSQVPAEDVATMMCVGELGLDGRVRPVAGALASALAMRGTKFNRVCTGRTDGHQMEVVPDIDVIALSSLAAVVARLRGESEPDDAVWEDVWDDGRVVTGGTASTDCQQSSDADLADVRGQSRAKEGLEIAATGGHHLAMFGRAGVGKTLLAERLLDLMPDLTDDEALEVTSIRQLATGAGAEGDLQRRPPWQAPHHSASRAAIVGGGTVKKPTIGVVSRAHRGVLFLDEAAEFDPYVLDSMREPMDSGYVSLDRSDLHITLPARCQIVMATNPCPCGNALDTDRAAPCRCTPTVRRNYLARLSGPFVDRFDIRVTLNRPTHAELSGIGQESERTAEVAKRVRNATEKARTRMRGTGWHKVAHVPNEVVREVWPLDAKSSRELDAVCARDSLRGRDRVLRVAWTVADLGQHESPTVDDIARAASFRSIDPMWSAL